MTLAEKVRSIKSLPLFANFTDKEITFLAKNVEKKEYAPYDLIIKQEDYATAAYFILEGTIKVYRNQKDGKVVNLSILGPGEIIGELSLIDNQPRSASVEAIQKTTVLEIKKSDFNHFLKKHPKASIELLKVITKRLRLIHKNLEKTVQGTLVERTTATLKSLGEFYPNREITLSHEQLAEIVGATRARITEVLDYLSKTKQLILSRKKIILLK